MKTFALEGKSQQVCSRSKPFISTSYDVYKLTLFFLCTIQAKFYRVSKMACEHLAKLMSTRVSHGNHTMLPSNLE